MPRFEPHNPGKGEPAPKGAKLMTRDKDGNLVPIFPDQDPQATTEARPRPQQADDPRTGPMRNVPPYGAGA